ncbi:T9SS type A sorting domain-containing protein [bacterium]|nr:T9SS type A sorting domain-containing protein [bacterium]
MFKGKLVFLSATIMLLAGLALAQSWSYTVAIEPEVGASYDLTFGVSAGATDDYDAYLDVPYFTPPDGRGAFFPLASATYPKLSADIRGFDSPPDYKYWIMRVEGYYGLDDRLATWDTTTIPDVGVYSIASKSIIDDIDDIDAGDWVEISTVEEFAFGPIEDAVVRFMPEAMLDDEPPYVTGFNPLDGEAGIGLDDPIQFDVKDDIIGVDPTSIVVMIWNDTETTPVDVSMSVVWTPIVGGYRASLAPVDTSGLWPELTIISYSVTACDLYEPANCMVEPVEVTFTTTEYIEDEDPPQFYNFDPVENDTTVDIDRCIYVSIRDNERGVDSSTIVLTVNDVVIPRDDYTVTELGTGLNRYSIDYCLPGGMAYSTWYTVEVEAADLADIPNDADTNWMFRTKAPGDLPEFTYQLIAHSFDDGDTASTNLWIGLDTEGSEYYDAGIDVPQFLIPGRARGYFPIMDPTHPSITALSTDIKEADYGIKEWIVDVFEPDENLVLAWNNDAMPLSGAGATFEFAVVERGMFPSSGDYTLMELYSTAEFDGDQQVFIRMLPGGGEDTTAPVVLNITHEGDGADVTAPLCFDVVDFGSGVDMSSFSLTIGGLAVVDYSISPISGGYHISYIPALGWSDLASYTVDLHVDDNAPVPNHRHKIWTFRTGSIACGPEFTLDLTFTYTGGVEAIMFGMDEEASATFDLGTDEILPPPSPSASGYHFATSESAPYDRLVADVRNNCELGGLWKVAAVAGDMSVAVEWNPSAPIFSDDRVDVYYKVLSVVDPMPARPYNDSTWSVFSDETSIVYNSNTQFLWVSVDYPSEVIVENFNISGTVSVFGEDNNSGVRVAVTGGSWVETDSTGDYGFTGLPLGCIELTYTYGLWTPVVDTVCGTVSGETVVNDVTVYPPCQMVYGVISVDGMAMTGVNVLVISASEADSFQMNTLSGGAYNFPCVPSGTYTLTLSYPAYPLWDTTFTVTSTDVEIDHNLIQVPVAVSGIASLSGTPTEAIAIYVDGTAAGVTTDSLGEFSVDVLIGLHTICAQYSGYVEACTTVNVPREGVTGLNLNLLPASVSLRVEVDLAHGTDESGATVQLVGVGTETTPSSGVVNFVDLAHGYYSITVSAPYHKTVTVDSIYMIADETVDVSLCYLEPVTAFSATGETVVRPTTEALAIDLVWTEPGTTCAFADTYYVYRSEMPFTDVTLPTVSIVAKVAAPAVGYSDDMIDDGTAYYYDVAVKYDAESFFSPLVGNQEATSQTIADTFDILVVDWDNGATPCDGGTRGVGEWWNIALASPTLNLDFSVTMTDEDATDPLAGYDLDDYMLVVLALGINDADNTTLPAAALAKLEDYRATGGKKIIVEGPDFGADYDGEDFFDNMNLNLVNDGSPDFNVAYFWGTPVLWGNPAIPYMAAEYDSAGDADHLVDVLATTNIGITPPVGFDQDSIPRIFFYNGPSQAMVGAIYLGGIVDPVVTQLRAASAYLWKLGIENDYIKQVDNKRPTDMAILGAYPNPFNPVTTVKFDVSEASNVGLSVYDITGKRVETLVDLVLNPGTYSTTWDASGMTSGVYFIRMISGGKNSTTKITLMK